MSQKITLPVSQMEVELVVMSWEESKSHFKRAEEHKEQGGSADDFTEEFLRKHYPKKVLDQAFKARPDVMALANDTIVLNFLGVEHIKNLSRSGNGAPTQTD